MADPNVIIQGYSDSSKVPGFFGKSLFAQGRLRFGASPLRCLLVGLKTSAGSIVADGPAVRCRSKDDADTLAGPGSVLARQAYAAFDECAGLDGFEIWIASPAPPSGSPTAATCVITPSGTLTANGSIFVSVGGDLHEVTVSVGDSLATIGGKIVTAINNNARGVTTAAAVSEVVTLTTKNTWLGANQHICYVDFSGAPGITVALSGTGGAAVTSSATVVGRTFGGGTGTATLTTLQTAILPMQFSFAGVSQNDATSLAAWETHCDNWAAPTEVKPCHFVVASNGNFAAATSLAQTTLNNARFTLKWLEISERHPSEIAAAVAALRAALEGTTPNKSYDDYRYKTLVPQRFTTDWVSTYAEKQAALDVGVSPLRSAEDGGVYEVRSITTRCMNGASADYRTLDTSESYVPDYALLRVGSVYLNEVKPACPYVRPNPAAGQPDPPAGVLTPTLWNARVARELREMERERITTQVTENPPSSEYNYTANRIMTAMPVVPLPANHAVGVLSLQLNVSETA